MAKLEHISCSRQICEVIDGRVTFTPLGSHLVERLPQIFWSDQAPWQEPNLWAYERAVSGCVDMQTVEANLRGLTHYANFLESVGLKWFEFPLMKADRCLIRYRGHLKDAIKNSELSPSTASARMRSVIAFYRWAQQNGLLSPTLQLWSERDIYIKYFDITGFQRTLQRVTTDLSIPNRARPGDRLEGGLLPVSAADRNAILQFAKTNASLEMFLMLSLGFFTGMRLSTISDLKIKSLENAVSDPVVPNMFLVAVGPGASPSVSTKFGVTGSIWITRDLIDALKEYAYSTRRLVREAKALPSLRDTLFLTRFGNSYSRNGSDKSSALNVEMVKFRRDGVRAGLECLRHFHFHQTRCTFGTELATLALKAGGEINAIAFVRNALLHRDEATTFKYIKFVKTTPVKELVANEFTYAFLGAIHRATQVKV